MRIAYLEDEVETATCVAGWLRDAGYQVEMFHSGEACARAVIGDRFDAVLLDWMVPDLSGTEVLARLQIKLRQAMPPVVFATGRDSEDDNAQWLLCVTLPVSNARNRERGEG